jgi:hypothetical protein
MCSYGDYLKQFEILCFCRLILNRGNFLEPKLMISSQKTKYQPDADILITKTENL